MRDVRFLWKVKILLKFEGNIVYKIFIFFFYIMKFFLSKILFLEFFYVYYTIEERKI